MGRDRARNQIDCVMCQDERPESASRAGAGKGRNASARRGTHMRSAYDVCARSTPGQELAPHTTTMPEVLKFQCADAGARLDAFLAARLAGLSRMRIARLIGAGACTINGARGAAGQRVAAGDLVELELDSDAPSAMTPEPLPLRIVYEDTELLVVDKPAGLLMHPTRGVKTGTLANALTYHLNRSRMADGGLRNAEFGLRRRKLGLLICRLLHSARERRFDCTR